MKNMRTLSWVFALSGFIIWLLGVMQSTDASPWYWIIAKLFFAAAITMSIIYGINTVEQHGKRGNLVYKVMIVAPVYILITIIIDIVNL